MVWAPKITTASQEKQLDEVFRVAWEMAKHCQDIIDCKACELRCSGLLMTMSILQETRPCFGYTSKSELPNREVGATPVVWLALGYHEVGSNSVGICTMLATNLVQQAAAVAIPVGKMDRSMINELAEPYNLANTSIT